MKKCLGYDQEDLWLCSHRWGLYPDTDDNMTFAYPGPDYFRWIDEAIYAILFDKVKMIYDS